MKLLLSLILIICLTFSLCFGTYINFIPKTLKDYNSFKNNNLIISKNNKQQEKTKVCFDDVLEGGYGYSILVDTCFTLDGFESHIIKPLDNNPNVYMHNIYSNGNADCISGYPKSSNPIIETDCSSTPILFNLNCYNYYLNAVKITFTNDDINNALKTIPSNCYVNSYYSNLSNCKISNTSSSSTTSVLEYMFSGTFSNLKNSSFFLVFSCNQQGIPMLTTCDNNAPFCPRPIQNNLNCISKPEYKTYLTTSCTK